MLAGRLTLPFALTSGKFGTPCARIQSEYLTPCGEAIDEALLLDLLDEPHPASASTKLTAASTADTAWRLLLDALLELAERMRLR
jgi:hypothetical protein